MSRQIVSKYQFDPTRTAAETLDLAEASKAQLQAPEPMTQERRLVVIDSWARALGDAWQDFDQATSKKAADQINIANDILKSGLEKEMFWGALQASVIAGSEEENGDIFVALATMHYLESLSQWGYQESIKAGLEPADLGNAFQYVPECWIADARKMVETWADGAPEPDRPRIYAALAAELQRVGKAIGAWGGKLRKEALSVAGEWAERDCKACR